MPTDKGTSELRRKKRLIGGGREDLELTPAAVLLSRQHLDRVQYDCLDNIAQTLRLSHAAVPGINIGGLWRMIVAATSHTANIGASAGALGLAVANARRLGWVLRQVDGSQTLILQLAEGQCPALVCARFVTS